MTTYAIGEKSDNSSIGSIVELPNGSYPGYAKCDGSVISAPLLSTLLSGDAHWPNVDLLLQPAGANGTTVFNNAKTGATLTNSASATVTTGPFTTATAAGFPGTGTGLTSATGGNVGEAALPISGNWTSVASNGSIFVAIGASQTSAYTSATGATGTWTARALPSTANWYKVIWTGAKFIAVAQSSTAIAVSTDGITWTAGGTLPVATGSYPYIAWNGSTYCIISFQGTNTMTSPDGVTWTNHPSVISNGSNYWGSIAANNNIFVVSNALSGYAATSPDGITWAYRTLPAGSLQWSKVIWTGTVFVMFAGANEGYGTPNSTTQCAISYDGLSWSTYNLSTTNTTAGAAVGSNGQIFTVGGGKNANSTLAQVVNTAVSGNVKLPSLPTPANDGSLRWQVRSS
jgi:hypothetical protein